ncbi:MAG: chemotaxis protein [Lysinibacillus sp.]
MLLFAVPDPSTETASYKREHIRNLRVILTRQQEDLTELNTIVGYLKGFKDVGIDQVEREKYMGKIEHMEEKQQSRFDRLDEMIFENRREVKKGKTKDESIAAYGKEVRKLEAGLRTLRLFTCDVVEMLAPDSTVPDRTDDRIGYFEKRSATLEVEMKTLMEGLPFL